MSLLRTFKKNSAVQRFYQTYFRCKVIFFFFLSALTLNWDQIDVVGQTFPFLDVSKWNISPPVWSFIQLHANRIIFNPFSIKATTVMPSHGFCSWVVVPFSDREVYRCFVESMFLHYMYEMPFWMPCWLISSRLWILSLTTFLCS